MFWFGHLSLQLDALTQLEEIHVFECNRHTCTHTHTHTHTESLSRFICFANLSINYSKQIGHNVMLFFSPSFAWSRFLVRHPLYSVSPELCVACLCLRLRKHLSLWSMTYSAQESPLTTESSPVAALSVCLIHRDLIVPPSVCMCTYMCALKRTCPP